MLTSHTDAELLARSLDRDQAAFAVLVNRYIGITYQFIFRLTGGSGESSDIVQEAFFKAWKNIKKFKQGSSFKTWLFTIARNTAFDVLRKKSPTVFSDYENEDGANPLTDSLVDPSPLPDELLARAEEAGFLDALLTKIPATSREVLLLYYVEGLTFDEIGKVLKKSINTVKSQHRRAIVSLRKLL